jgi:GDPmannose 4,6-dehydratase
MHSKRDWGHALDYVKGMHLMLQQSKAEEFVLATGETYTIKDFVNEAFRCVNIPIFWKGKNEDEVAVDERTGNTVVKVNKAFYRPSEVELLLGDPIKAETVLGWKREYNFQSLVKEMIDADMHRLK